MGFHILHAFARQAEAILDRRRTLRGIGLGTVAAAAAGLDDALAKNKNKDKKQKRRKRRRRKDRKRNNASPPSCAEQCPEEFDHCVDRAADSSLCADQFSTQCNPCFSDQDCLGSEFAYCVGVNGITVRATGAVFPLNCGGSITAVCTALAP